MAYAKINTITNANMAKVNNAAKAALGKIGSIDAPSSFTNSYSLEFDGTNDYVLIDSGFKIGATTSSSSIWFKYNAHDDGATPGNSMLVSPVSPTNDFYFWVSGNLMRIYHSLYGTNSSVLSWSFEEGVRNDWHHLVVTFNQSAGEMKFYGNGELKDTNSTSVSVHAGYADVHLARFSGNTWGILGGNLDEMGNWNSVLSAAEITAIYNSGTPTDLRVDAGDYASSGNLDGYWRFGDGDSYPTIQDLSGEGNNGTMTNMASGDIVTEVPSA